MTEGREGQVSKPAALALLALVVAALLGGSYALLRLRQGQLDPARLAFEAEGFELARHLELYENAGLFDRLIAEEPQAGASAAPEQAPAAGPPALSETEAQWKALPPAERARVEENYRRLERLSPAERDAATGRCRRVLELPPRIRQGMLERFERESRLNAPGRPRNL